MRRSTGTWSASLLPPTKLYFASPVHRAAGAGKPAASTGAKSNDADVMNALSLMLWEPAPSVLCMLGCSDAGG